MRSRSCWAVLLAFLLLLTACNAPLSPQASATPNLVATITAQARIIQAARSATPPGVPVTGGSATPAVPQVRLTSPTNCRTGPSIAYGIVFLAYPGTNFQVVGRYTPGNYWIIDNPAGGTCWLWGQFAIVSGNVASVPEFPVPPAPVTSTKTPASTPTTASAPTATATPMATSTGTIVPTVPTQAPPPPPAAPTNLQQSRTCASGTRGMTPIWFEDITLTWHDTTGETGYRIYQNGTAITTIPQNSNSYQIELRYDQGTAGPQSDNFGVEAYNSGGASPRPSVDVPRCP